MTHYAHFAWVTLCKQIISVQKTEAISRLCIVTSFRHYRFSARQEAGRYLHTISYKKVKR